LAFIGHDQQKEASMNKILYTAVATALGGRRGHDATNDGNISHDLASPGGPQPAGKTNPEQLFASGYSACFGSAIEHVARQKHVTVSTVQVTAHVMLGTTEAGGYALAVKLVVKLAGVSLEVAQQLADAAHQVCPYSHATRGNIPVEITVEA